MLGCVTFLKLHGSHSKLLVLIALSLQIEFLAVRICSSVSLYMWCKKSFYFYFLLRHFIFYFGLLLVFHCQGLCYDTQRDYQFRIYAVDDNSCLICSIPWGFWFWYFLYLAQRLLMIISTTFSWKNILIKL